MSQARYDVLGIGNAIVDVITRAEDTFLRAHNIQKSGMTLIDEPRAESLYAAMGETVIASGGSAANTIAGLGSLGSRCAYTGKVRDDQLGALFTSDIRRLGVHFPTGHATSGPSTARCLIVVTPDGERSMSTYLGACQQLGPADIDAEAVSAADVTYLEGYLWDPPAAKEAFRRAADIAHAAGRKVALTLSDSFCVDRYRSEFLDLMRTNRVDIVFANAHEIRSLYETADFETAVACIRRDAGLAVVTRSELGCLAATASEVVHVNAFPVSRIVDTSGAGDLFAAGFLHGFTKGFPHGDSLKLGAYAAAETIAQIGPRPPDGLKARAAAAGMRV